MHENKILGIGEVGNPLAKLFSFLNLTPVIYMNEITKGKKKKKVSEVSVDW